MYFCLPETSGKSLEQLDELFMKVSRAVLSQVLTDVLTCIPECFWA